MRALFADATRYALFVRVEGALAEVQGRHGVIPAEAARHIARCAREFVPDVPAVARSERTTGHELFSVVQLFAQSCGPHGRFVHFGATSSDILDTALALQTGEAIGLLRGRLTALLAAVRDRIAADGDRLMIGRTHGQHAQPITFGFKLAIHLDQLARCLVRLDELSSRVLMGKVAGAVGTFAGLGPLGPLVQREVLDLLGLSEPQISAQAVARDRIAEFVCWAALTAACLENLATEIRNLQRTEIGEVAESFNEGDQIGSSAMPHKRNPVRCERVCSLARLVRSLVGPALENVVTWHERDLANSANERFTLPQTGVLLDEMLSVTTSVVTGLRVRPDRMEANLALSRGAYLSEAVMLALVERGVPRLTGYRALQRATAEAAAGGPDLLTALAGDPEVTAVMSAEELAERAGALPDAGASRALTEETVRRAERLLAAAPVREGAA